MANTNLMDEIFFKLKELLKSVGWIVQASSDGTTYNATGDIITSFSSGAGGLGNNTAWFRITTPNQKEEFVWQRGGNTQSYRLKWSPLSKFIGGTPGTTRTPAAGDETFIFGGGTDTAPSYNGSFGTVSNYRIYMGADADAPYGWYISVIQPAGYSGGTGASMPFFMFFDGLSQTETTDPCKSIVVSGVSSTGIITSYSSSTDTTLTSSGTRCVSRIISASTGNEASIGFAMLTLGESSTLYAGNCMGNPINNREEILPIAFGRRAALVTPGFKGFCTTYRVLGSNKAHGDTITVNTTRDRIIIGQFVLPWDGSVPTV